MKFKVAMLFVIFIATSNLCAWEPSQAPAKRVAYEYNLFKPFGSTKFEISIDSDGVIDHFIIKTDVSSITIPREELEEYRYPSLADVEVMYFHLTNVDPPDELDFSICIPYGRLKRVDDGKYFQRPTLVIMISKKGWKIRDIPIPENNTFSGGANGCENASIEYYGF